MSFAVTPSGSLPLTVTRMFLECWARRVWVASTCSTSEVPMPKASAPKAPWVEVCESPQTIVIPGWVTPSSGPITCTIPCRSEPSEYTGTPNSSQLRSSVSTCTRESSSLMRAATGVPSVGVLWSAVASVRSGRRSLRPASRRLSNACGLVTSCTRCRSMYSRPELAEPTSCASQILSNIVCGVVIVLSLRGPWVGGESTATQTGADDSQEARGLVGRVLEMVWKVGVEGHTIALRQLIALPVAHEHDSAPLHERGLAATRLVHRRIVRSAGGAAGRERMPGQLRALSGLRGGHYFEAMAALGIASLSTLWRADDRDRSALVEAQQLGEAQVEPGGDAGGDGQRRARLPSLDLREHRRADPAAL